MHELVQAMADWLEAATQHASDPVKGSRYLEAARRRFEALAVKPLVSDELLDPGVGEIADRSTG